MSKLQRLDQLKKYLKELEILKENIKEKFPDLSFNLETYIVKEMMEKQETIDAGKCRHKEFFYKFDREKSTVRVKTCSTCGNPIV